MRGISKSLLAASVFLLMGSLGANAAEVYGTCCGGGNPCGVAGYSGATAKEFTKN